MIFLLFFFVVVLIKSKIIFKVKTWKNWSKIVKLSISLYKDKRRRKKSVKKIIFLLTDKPQKSLKFSNSLLNYL